MKINSTDIDKTLEKARTVVSGNENLSSEIKSLMNMLIMLVTVLCQRLKINSSNSSKPPSQDPNRDKNKGKKSSKSKKKSGGQPGHKGQTLKKVANPDKVIPITIDKRRLPRGEYKEVGSEKRQVVEFEVSRKVIEYQAQILEDASGQRFVAEFPKHITKAIQYGSSVKGHAVYMTHYQMSSDERTADHFWAQLGIPLSQGSLSNFEKAMYKLLAPFEESARYHLQKATVLNADETGINVGGKNHWLHVVSNSEWTLMSAHRSRGKIGLDALGVLENYTGIVCHDHFKAYYCYRFTHALCNAHHKRELQWVIDNEEHRWASSMQALLLKINEEVSKSGGVLRAKQIKYYKKRYRQILTWGSKECPHQEKEAGKRGIAKQTKARNLLVRLRDYEGDVLRFMTETDVPFTNNRAENDIRMTKVKLKISGCFRSLEWAEIFCRIRSYISTCRKRGINITEALTMLFEGKLPDFCTIPKDQAE